MSTITYTISCGYLMLCSKLSNSAVPKNCPNVIPKPSQSILIVSTFGFLLLPYRIFFTEDGGNPERFASLFMLMFRSSHNCKILLRIA